MATPASTPPTTLHLQLKGTPRLQRGGGDGWQALPARLAALLALLAVDGPQSRARVAELFYPKLDSAAARRNLRQLLFAHRALLAELLDGCSDALALSPGVSTDTAEPPAGDADETPLLGALTYDDAPAFAQWLHAQREQRQQQRIDTLASQASALEANGQIAPALAVAQRLIALNPASEHAHRRLMRLHYLRGDRAAALAAFDRCEQVLRDELSAKPGAETLDLLAQIEQAHTPTALSARPAPAAMLRPPRVVGRDAEWAQLHQAWQAGTGLLLLGEPGMGKSRLLGDLALATPGCLLISAAAGDAAQPYALLSRLLRRLLAEAAPPPSASLRAELARLLPELGDTPAIASDDERARFLNATLALARQALAAGWPGLVLDDLHFADAASLAALPGLLGLPGMRWAAAACPAELGAAAQGLGRLSALHALNLPPLDVAAVAALLDSLALPELQGLDAAALQRQSGGNPLFLLEGLKHWLSQPESRRGDPASTAAVAPRVGELVLQRLARLTLPAVQLVRCAALAGPDFSAALAAEVLGQRLIDLTEPWSELEAAQLLRDGALAQDLVRDAALSSVPPALARELHAQIAGFLARQPGTPPARLAAHWQAAARWDAATQAYLAAAAQARRTLRRIEEGHWLRLAADCARAGGDTRAEFESTLARAEAALCESLGAEPAQLAQQALQMAADETEQLRALAVMAATMARRIDDFGPHRAACEEGIHKALRLGRPELALQLALPLAGSLLNAREIGAALQLLESQQDWAQAEAEPALMCDYLNHLGMALDYANRLADAAQVHERQCELARRHGLHEATATALASLGATLAKRGRLRAATQALERGLQLARSQQSLVGQVLHSQATLGWRLRDLGDYRDALALMEDARDGLVAAGPGTAAAFNVVHRLALAYAHLGQHARARHTLQSHSGADDELPARQALWRAHSAELARLAGDTALARADALTALRLLEDQRDDMPYRVVCLLACPLLEPEAGEAMAAGLAAWAAAHERHGLALAAHLRGIDCALRADDAQRLRGHLEAALGLGQRFDSEIVFKGEFWLRCAEAQLHLGNPAAARALVAQGQRWVQACCAEQVPPAFADSFLHRNPVNLGLQRLQASMPDTAAAPEHPLRP